MCRLTEPLHSQKTVTCFWSSQVNWCNQIKMWVLHTLVMHFTFHFYSCITRNDQLSQRWLEGKSSGRILKWHNTTKTASRHCFSFCSLSKVHYMVMTRVRFTLTGISGWHPLTQLVVHKSDSKQRACPAIFLVCEMPDCAFWNWPPRSSRRQTALKQMDVWEKSSGFVGFLIKLVMTDSRAVAAGRWAGKWAKPRLWQIQLSHDVLKLQQGSASINRALKNVRKYFTSSLNCFALPVFPDLVLFWCSDATGPYHWWEWASKLRCESSGGVLVVSLCLKARQRKSCGAEQRLSVYTDTLTLRSRLFRGQRLETAQQTFVLPLWKSVFTN